MGIMIRGFLGMINYMAGLCQAIGFLRSGDLYRHDDISNLHNEDKK